MPVSAMDRRITWSSAVIGMVEKVGVMVAD